MNRYTIIYPFSEGFPKSKASSIQTINTCHALAKAGVEVELLVGSLNRKDPEESLAYYGLSPHPLLKIHSLPILRKEDIPSIPFSWNLVFHIASLYTILKIIKKRKPRAVLYLRHLKMARFLLKWKGIIKIPMLYEGHEPFFLTKKKKEMKELESFVFNGVEAIVATTERLKEVIRENFNPSVPIYLIRNGGDIPLSSPRQEKVEKGVKEPLILYTGILSPWKGVDTLVRAMEFVEGAKLVIAGGREADIERLMEIGKKGGFYERITFVGHILPSEVGFYLSQADVVVLPSTGSFIDSEFTSPLKLFSYMLAKKAIVASNLPSLREVLVNEKNSLLVKPDDPFALAQGIKRLITDIPLRERITLKAYEEAQENYTWEARAEKIKEVVDSLMKKREG